MLGRKINPKDNKLLFNIFEDGKIDKRIIIRNVPKMTEDYKNLVARFIFFIDVIYENKNILYLEDHSSL